MDTFKDTSESKRTHSGTQSGALALALGIYLQL